MPTKRSEEPYVRKKRTPDEEWTHANSGKRLGMTGHREPDGGYDDSEPQESRAGDYPTSDYDLVDHDQSREVEPVSAKPSMRAHEAHEKVGSHRPFSKRGRFKRSPEQRKKTGKLEALSNRLTGWHHEQEKREKSVFGSIKGFLDKPKRVGERPDLFQNQNIIRVAQAIYVQRKRDGMKGHPIPKMVAAAVVVAAMQLDHRIDVRAWAKEQGVSERALSNAIRELRRQEQVSRISKAKIISQEKRDLHIWKLWHSKLDRVQKRESRVKRLMANKRLRAEKKRRELKEGKG